MKLKSSMFNVKPSPVDSRDFTLPHVGSDEVIDDFIVGEDTPIIYNQGNSSMCTAFSINYLQEFYEPDVRFSPAFLYGNREDGDYEGEGEYLREAIKDWHRDGVCYFSDFPLISDVDECIEEFDLLPESIKVYAKEHRIEAFYKLNHKDPQGVFELMEMFNLPVLASIPLYQSFAKAFDDGGVVPLPDVANDKYLGGHAVALWGKKTIDGLEHYILPNSWGDVIPDSGVQYIPIDYPIWEIYIPLPYVKKTVTLIQDESIYFVNDELRMMDSVPVNKNGRVYVPLRFFVEALGNVYVEWNNESRTASIYRGGDVLQFKEGADGFFSAYTYGYTEYESEEREGLTVNYIDENNRMMIPVRKISEVFGYDVNYDDKTKIITISN